MRTILIAFFLLSVTPVLAQSRKPQSSDFLQQSLNKLDPDRAKWSYFKLKEIRQGEVLKQSIGCCCYVNIATITYVKTPSRDTIRVISACMAAPLSKGDLVLIKPLGKDTVSRNGSGDLKYDRIVSKTTYGEVAKLN